MKLMISIIIPTFNRLDLLKRTLLSLIAQDFDKKSYEIIVADNCSYNWADKIVDEIDKGLSPKIIHLKINEQGVNKARNEGIKVAKGEIIAFCDDDVLVDKLWLKNIIKAHRKFPTVLAIGGKVEPIWEIGKPSWLPKRMEDYLALLNFDKSPLKNPPWLVSANLSLKRKTFEMFGSFDESLGRKKGSFMFKDEVEFLERIKAGKGEILYLSEIKVEHFISKKRLTLKFLIRRTFWEGRSEAKVDKMMKKKLLRRNWTMLGQFFFKIPQGILFLARNNKKEAVEILMSQIFNLGYFYQALLERINL